MDVAGAVSVHLTTAPCRAPAQRRRRAADNPPRVGAATLRVLARERPPDADSSLAGVGEAPVVAAAPVPQKPVAARATGRAAVVVAVARRLRRTALGANGRAGSRRPRS